MSPDPESPLRLLLSLGQLLSGGEPKSFGMQGTLKGYDQATNLVLHDCHERVYSLQVGHGNSDCTPCASQFTWGTTDTRAANVMCLQALVGGQSWSLRVVMHAGMQKGMERQMLGLQVVRGDNM